MKKIDLLHNQNDFVKEIMETPPNKVIRWGNTFFLGFLLLILALSWIIQYPDIVTSEVVLTTNNPPVFLSAKMQGKIDTILKSDKETVKKNEWIAVIGSNANLNHIYTLDTLLQKIKRTNYTLEELKDTYFPILNVGEIQPDYNALVKSVVRFKHRKDKGNYEVQSKINTLQVQYYKNLIDGAIKDLTTAEEELKLAESDLNRHKGLLEKGVISQREFEAIKSSYLLATRKVENNKSKILEIKGQRLSFKSQGSNLKQDEEELYLNYELDILEAVKLTELAFIRWQKRHLLISTVSGEINYINHFTNNQYVEPNQKLLSIVPTYKEEEYFGIAKMPIANSGKVKVGQTVNIKLHGFPYQEYGTVLGFILDISKVPNENSYFVKIDLQNGLNTSYNKKIPFTQNINGAADIITEDLRMIERFVYTLTKAFK